MDFFVLVFGMNLSRNSSALPNCMPHNLGMCIRSLYLDTGSDVLSLYVNRLVWLTIHDGACV
jgi:hypothetical protein